MLWRTSYSTETLVDQEIDWENDGVFLFAPGPYIHAELGIWMKLLSEAYPDQDLYRIIWRKSVESTVAEMFPRSEMKKMVFVETFPEFGTDRLVSAVVQGSKALVLMVGPATEEAWDEFREAISRSGSNPAVFE